jgi:hypothetical protein
MKSKLRKRRTVRAAARRFRRRATAPPKRDARETGVLIGGAHDPAEKAADRAAEQVMAGKKVASMAPATAAVHRACAGCEEGKKDKKDEKARRSARGAPAVAPGATAGRAGSQASASIRSMGPGKPLSRADRSFFEPRFGRDLSEVRVHDGPAADRAARLIDARAFAWGSDIAFASGERERGGARLLSHELAHVATGDRKARRMVHRATIATADGPENLKKVPDGQRRDVQRALNLVGRALKAKRCRDYFEEKCKDGAADSAQKAFDRAIVYYAPDAVEFGLSKEPNIVAYNKLAFKIGRWEIASTLLHELFHTCDPDKDAMDEIVAEGATEMCGFYTPWLVEASPDEPFVGDPVTVRGMAIGQKQDANHYLQIGRVKITDYDEWQQGTGPRSDIVVKFKVPETMIRPGGGEKNFDIVAVNHGVRSNAKTVSVARM